MKEGTFNVYYYVDKHNYFMSHCSYYNYNQYQKLIHLSTLVLHFLTFVIDRIADLLMVRKDVICTVHALYNGRYGMSGNTYIEERGRMIIKTK